MYVCICNNVTERDIRRAVSDGASSLACLRDQLCVASCCGQCTERALDCLETALEEDTPQLMTA